MNNITSNTHTLQESLAFIIPLGIEEWNPDPVQLQFAGEEVKPSPPRDLLPPPIQAQTAIQQEPIDSPEPIAECDNLEPSNQYRLWHGHLTHYVQTEDNRPKITPLCNFFARIIEEISHDNGNEVTKHFKITGRHQDNQPFPEITIPAKTFAAMRWPTEQWGARASIAAGHTQKDRLREAIQFFSQNATKTTVYAHIGWRKIDGKYTYLHAGGGIDTDGFNPDIRVESVSGTLEKYLLFFPTDGERLQQAVRGSLDCLKIARPSIMFALLSAVYRAPLGEASPVDFSVFLSGVTGSKKTSLTGIIQAHYGATFKIGTLPGNWSSTDNSIEREAFAAKDALFTVDDFKPGGTAADITKLHQKAERVLRAQGNQAGRGRMNADGSLQPTFFPQGLIQSSGEDLPRGQSLQARMVIGEIKQGDINLDHLTIAQDRAQDGMFCAAMAGFVQWLAPQMDRLKDTLPKRQQTIRDEMRQQALSHDRTPENLASLAVGWEKFLEFARATGTIDQTEFDLHWKDSWAALLEIGHEQNLHQSGTDPILRFVTLITTAFNSGLAHVKSVDGFYPKENYKELGWFDGQPGGVHIGWVNGEDLLLIPTAVYTLLQKMEKDQGGAFPLGERTLWKQLKDRGYLRRVDAKQNTINYSPFPGRVLCVSLKYIINIP